MLKERRLAESGFSIIEFIIVGALGLLLLSAVLSFYMAITQSYRLLIGLSHIEQNGTLAISLLERDIRMAGFMICPSSNTSAILGIHSGRTETDGIIIERADDTIINASSKMMDRQTIKLNLATPHSKPPDFHPGERLLITDCINSELFKIGSITSFAGSMTITADHLLQKNYDRTAMIARLSAIAYFLALTPRKNIAGKPIYALYRKDLYNFQNLPDEMVSGIDDLKLRYTAIAINDQAGRILQDLNADQVTMLHLWPQVVAVKIGLLISTPEPVFSKPHIFYFQGVKQAPSNQLHKEWNAYVAIRNRLRS